RKIIGALGEGYVSALREAHQDVPETTDLVGYWWHKAACLLRQRKIARFGFITTNSITQEYSRRVIEQHLDRKPQISFRFAIPDHPWVDTADGAAVRVAMHVVGPGSGSGILSTISNEDPDLSETGTSIVKFRDTSGIISGRLKLTEGNQKPQALQANGSMCFQGVVPAGDGFKLLPLSGLASAEENCSPIGPIRPYLIGKDLVQRSEEKRIIDCFGLTVSELESRFPGIFQHLLVTVKPERDHNRRQSYREKWWIFAEPRPALRRALRGLKRYVGTPYTAKYRPFVFIDATAIPDAMVYAIATDDAAWLGVLSSSIHGFWAKFAGGTLEDRPRYNSNGTFLPFPFPALDESPLKQRIRDLGEKLDAHRKARQAAHPGLTLTGMYNVLETLRRGEALGD
ncbi:MAG: class I SAM-dependent DNA methyltransferase, partial [Verrucomicrobiae bacterium]|nr:class I SAM-dependent DNA methyltransferase [Verrucomicrobiae bacterium]